jgi:pilus assembly protein CpaC
MKRFLKTTTAAAALGLALTGTAFAGDAGMAAAKTTTVKVDTGRGGAAYQTLTLGAGKAAIVELPVDVRDVLVSNPAALDAVVRSPRQVYLLGLTAGTSTNAVFFDVAGRQILNLDVTVGNDMSALEDLFKAYIPDADLKAEAVRGSMVLSGTVATAAEADRAVQLAKKFVISQSGSTTAGEVINLIQIAQSQQVLLKVRIVEMQRSLIKQLGLNLGAAGLTEGGHTAWRILQNNGGFAYDADTGTIKTPFTDGFDGGISSANGSTSIDATIKAMEELGLVRTLAEPNLTAISGSPAKFLAGGEIPVNSTLDQNGNVVVNYKPYGVGLGFTPVVMGAGRISLQLNTEVSDIGSGGTATSPTFNVRRAETTVEMASGNSLVIAGILQSRLRNTAMGTPGIKDVPVLGALFRSKDFLQEETELVIIVTPYLVNPTAPAKLQTAADGFQNADDGENLLLGRMNKVAPAAAK